MTAESIHKGKYFGIRSALASVCIPDSTGKLGFSGLWLHVRKSLHGDQMSWNALTQIQLWNPLAIICISLSYLLALLSNPYFADRTFNNNGNMEVEGLTQISITQSSTRYNESQET